MIKSVLFLMSVSLVSLPSLKEDDVFIEALVLLMTAESNIAAEALVGPNVDVVVLIDPNLFIDK